MTDPAPTVALHVWRIRPTAVPRAFWHMAVGPRRLRRTAGVRFAKLLGTGQGSGFGPGSADLTRWAALVVSEAGIPPPAPPTPATTERCTVTLRPLSSKGTWSGSEPFDVRPTRSTGPVLVLTRARLRARQAAAFWKAIGPPAHSLQQQEGLLAAFGVGEAPIGFQGTVSVWRDAADIVRYAYRQPEHAAVVDRTPRQRWYAEELFARFEVLDIAGDRRVLGWKEDP